MIKSATSSDGGKSALRGHEAVLLAVVAAEWIYFRAAAPSFGSLASQYNILRHSAEVGLLALALTPVILTGGIDLSVGSLLGLSAVVFGKLWRDAHFSLWLAGVAALGIGVVGGSVNAALITRLRLPPLIVTLGTYSLFRGLAEALTRGADTFTNFPASFLFWGNENWGGVPAQAPVFFAVAGGVWLLVHHTTYGRSFRAIGYAPEGARYAGLPVGRRVALVYVLAGFVAALAGLVYTARVGQAGADAGTGYELLAITAVVLGGANIFGGAGSVPGTLLGIAAVAVLVSGLEADRQPRELGGMLTGALLIAALSAGVVAKMLSNRRARRQTALPSSPTPTPLPS